MQYISETQIDQMTSEIGAKLRLEPKVRILLSEDGKGEYWEGGIGGHFFRIRKGQTVEVPASLATLMEQSAQTMRLSEEATKAYRGAGKKVG